MDHGPLARSAGDLSLSAVDFQRLDALFHQALDLPEAERLAFVERECDDDALRAELVAMLDAVADEAVVDRALDGIVIAGACLPETEVGDTVAPAAGLDGEVIDRIGPYRILEEIGRGGLATVYLADRDDDEFSRKVALKLIRRGMDTDDLLERLRLERQILANLDHPNIARLYDGGTAPDGRPYFVMEAIFGQRVDTWCASRQLPLDRRLDLFRKICAAVHFAHQNLVLHRDLKPSNIMVTEGGEPKLLDFGIAKLLTPGSVSDGRTAPLADVPTITEPGKRLLTPEFASPEQIRAEPLTTASDVYSLGIVLYLLVTGERPYTFDRRRPAEIERIVCEQEPPKPSRVLQVGDHRGAPDWRPAAGGDDLDNIVLMALHKDSTRRYASAAELAEDIARYQSQQTVKARPDTFLYRTRTFVRRNRLAVTVAASLITMLLTAVVVTTQQTRVAQAERQRADAQRLRAEESLGFLVHLFAISDPFSDERSSLVDRGGEQIPLGEQVTARQVLDEGARQVRSSLHEAPETRSDLLHAIGIAYRNLSLLDEAEALQEEAIVLRRQTLGDEAPATLEAIRELAVVRLERDQSDDADRLLAEVLDGQVGLFGDDHLEVAETLFWQAQVAWRQREFVLAEQRFATCLDIRQRHLDDDDPDLAAARRGLGEALFSQGRFADASRIFEQVLSVQRRLRGEAHPEIATVLNNLALARQQLGLADEALPLLQEVVDMRRALLGDRHGHVAQALYNLATAQMRAGRGHLAEPLAHEALTIYRHVYGEQHDGSAQTLLLLGALAQRRGALDAAREHLSEALAIRRQLFGDAHMGVAQVYYRLARVAERAQDVAEAERRYRECLAVQRRVSDPTAERLRVRPLTKLGSLLLARDRAAEAVTVLTEAVEIQHRQGDPLATADLEVRLAESLAAAGQIDAAREQFVRCLAAYRDALPGDDAKIQAVEAWLDRLAPT